MAEDAQARENERLARDARTREIVREEMREERIAVKEERAVLWDQFGFDIRSGAGIREVKQTLAGLGDLGINILDTAKTDEWAKRFAWLADAHIASVTRNKRLLSSITYTVVTLGGIAALIKYYLEWRH